MVWVVWLLRAMGRHGRFENFRIGPSLSNRIGTADSNSNRISKLRRSLVFLRDLWNTSTRPTRIRDCCRRRRRRCSRTVRRTRFPRRRQQNQCPEQGQETSSQSRNSSRPWDALGSLDNRPRDALGSSNSRPPVWHGCLNTARNAHLRHSNNNNNK